MTTIDRFDHYITKPLQLGLDYGLMDNDMFWTAANDSADVMALVKKFCETHPSALSGGSEWLNQSDGQTQSDAIQLVGAILDKLSWYGK